MLLSIARLNCAWRLSFHALGLNKSAARWNMQHSSLTMSVRQGSLIGETDLAVAIVLQIHMGSEILTTPAPSDMDVRHSQPRKQCYSTAT